MPKGLKTLRDVNSTVMKILEAGAKFKRVPRKITR